MTASHIVTTRQHRPFLALAREFVDLVDILTIARSRRIEAATRSRGG